MHSTMREAPTGAEYIAIKVVQEQKSSSGSLGGFTTTSSIMRVPPKIIILVTMKLPVRRQTHYNQSEPIET